MNSQKLRVPLLVGAIAAVAATAWAANETYETITVVEPIVVAEPPATVNAPAAVSAPIAASETLSPNETIVVKEETTIVKTEASLPQPSITVEERRLSNDERIQLTVMDLLRNNDRLSGKIGVESNDSVVRLSGWTVTAGQARRAGQAAYSVQGVRHVENEIRPRIGGSI